MQNLINLHKDLAYYFIPVPVHRLNPLEIFPFKKNIKNTTC